MRIYDTPDGEVLDETPSAPDQSSVQGPIGLTALLDGIDSEVNSATKNEHWLALSLLVTPLVKALRLADKIIQECDPETVWWWNKDAAQLLREPCETSDPSRVSSPAARVASQNPSSAVADDVEAGKALEEKA